MVFKRSLGILLLGPIVARALIYRKRGNVWRILTVVLLIEEMLLLLFGGR